jgi:serine/threonine protein kinase
VSQTGYNPLPPGTVVRERYRIAAAVGQGGLGTVYQVTDVLFGRSNVYALKEQWDQSASARKQFGREGAWLYKLDHNHIPKVREYFEWHDRLYLVMDFVDGENLERKLERAAGRPLPESQVLGWVRPICDALHYLHTRTPPIIHRDVKPSNIIVTSSGHPVLVDLGIAKEHGPGTNATATFVRKAGTEGYAPPEQYAASGQSGPWSDVYGLGATLYQLLTTQIPPTAVERVALDATLRRPRALNPGISAATETAILKALAIRPQDRFQSMLDFARALPSDTSAPNLSPFPTPLPVSGRRSETHPAAPVARSGYAPGKATDGPMPAQSPRSNAATVTPRAGLHTPPQSRDPLSAPNVAGAPSQDGKQPGAHGSRLGVMPWIWSGGLMALVLAAILVTVSVLPTLTTVDRSTPHATVSGYFDALRARDYARAWQYVAASRNSVTSETDFARNLRADDDHNGRVLSVQIGDLPQDTSGHASGTVSVVRSLAASTPRLYTVVLTQYGDVWLIDSVTSEG